MTLKPLSQKDKRWADKHIGKTNYSLGAYGCLITSLAILTWNRPDELNDRLTRNNCFNRKGELDCSQAAKVLGLTYERAETPPDLDCIAETNYYRRMGYPQHFFIWLAESRGKMIIDPLTGLVQTNIYPIVSFRVFRKLEKA